MNLSMSLERIKVNAGKLLEGHTFFLTDKIGVEFKSLQKVIEASGGVVSLTLSTVYIIAHSSIGKARAQTNKEETWE